MTIGSLSSLATTAFATTRSTFKAMAEAAVPPADADRKTAAGAGEQTSSHTSTRTRAPATAPAAATTAGRAAAEEPARPTRRRGALLDAYA